MSTSYDRMHALLIVLHCLKYQQLADDISCEVTPYASQIKTLRMSELQQFAMGRGRYEGWKNHQMQWVP